MVNKTTKLLIFAERGHFSAHELFVLWQKRNPDIKLTVVNANDNVDFMIKRAIRTAENQAQ